MGSPPNGVQLATGTAIPMKYVITRPAYQLQIELGERAYLPNFSVSIRSNGFAEGLSVRPTTRGSCVAWTESKGVLLASLTQSDCPTTGTVQVTIADKGGMELGRESLHYRIVRDGVFCVADAI
jgi:hypothetical protein